MIDVEQKLAAHCPDGRALSVEVRPGRFKVTVGGRTRTVLVYKRKQRYVADFVSWLKRVCC